MSANALPVQFGEVKFYKEFHHSGKGYLFVVEVCKERRWMILYQKLYQEWVVMGRFVVCCPVDLYWIQQKYGSRLYCGASVDGDGSYLIVETVDHIYLLFFDGDKECGCLLDVMEIPSLDPVM
jgi:hypothetical protein